MQHDCSRSLCIQKLPRCKQIRGLEPFREATVNGGDETMCFESSSLATEQPGCADRGPEFPRQNRLAPRPVEELSKKLLCRRYGVVAPLDRTSSPLTRSNSAIYQRSSSCSDRSSASSIAARPSTTCPARPSASARSHRSYV